MIITFNGSNYPSTLQYRATYKTYFVAYGRTASEAINECLKQGVCATKLIVDKYKLPNYRNQNYGTGSFERVLFATFGVIIMAGFVGYVAGPAAAGVMAMIVMSMAAYLRFVPVWSALIVVFVGFFLLRRSTE